jgi:hypothetical protein
MRWLVRTITKKKQGAIEHHDELFSGAQLTIGRAAGQGVFLSDVRAALEHARIVPLKGTKYRIESMISAGVRVNGKLQQSAIGGPDTRIQVGGHELRIINPPAGYEGAVEVTEIETADEAAAGKFKEAKMSLDQTMLAKRWPAWLLFIGVLVFSLLIPVVGNMVPGLQEKLRAVPGVPDDGQWEAGTLASAHHFFGEDCSTCHTDAFVQVTDENCSGCHARTKDHAAEEYFAIPELVQTRCALCHRDHNGLQGLIRMDQKLCQDCHVDLQATSGNRTVLADVSDFTHQHPEFKVEISAWDLNGNYKPRREALDSDTLIEDSNLIFPHDKHLSLDGVKSPTGDRFLVCNDCHETEAGGGLMKPVDFEPMCQECHQLGFDPFVPNRQVPHGKPDEVLYMLQDYYARRALEGGYEDATAPTVVRQRRRPGQRLSRSETTEALSWARDKSRRVGKNLFEGQACGVCHRVTQEGEGETVRWAVAPVRVQGIWFPKSVFPHISHETMACESCHDARESAYSDDVLLPGIENCRTCHGGEFEEGKVVSTCVSCHRYHVYTEEVVADSG